TGEADPDGAVGFEARCRHEPTNEPADRGTDEVGGGRHGRRDPQTVGDELARVDIDDGRLDAASAHIDADRRARSHVRTPSPGLGTRSHRRATEVRVWYRLGPHGTGRPRWQ